MHPLIARILRKRGIEDFRQLQPEEKADIERWQTTFDETEPTVENVVKFCEREISKIETQMALVDNSSQKNDRLVLLHSVYRNMYGLLTKPQPEREELERYLQDLVQ